MTLGDKLRSLRSIEGSLRGLGRPLTQSEVVNAMKKELGRGLSQAYPCSNGAGNTCARAVAGPDNIDWSRHWEAGDL